MSRVSRDEMLMEVAHAIAKRGTCSRLQVGAVFSRDGRIVSTGYNGAPAGMPHCDHSNELQAHYITLDEGVVKPELEQGCQTAEHAERNAIAWAARHGLALEGTEVHVTHMPCLACSRTLVNAGVTKLTYDEPYRLREGIVLLGDAGVEVWEYNRHFGSKQIDPRF